MGKKYLIGIDIGTTSVKTIICDALMYKIVSTASAEHDLFSLYSGWAEENPEDWWNNTIKTINFCIKESGINPKQISGIGVSGMVPAFILIDSFGNVLRPSMQQNDARTFKEIEIIEKSIGRNRFFDITGSVVNQQMIGPKILWMKKNEPEIFSKTDKILGSYDYIVYKLTGKLSLERNWALESGLYDVNLEDWSDELLEVVNVKRNLFPQINKPSDVVGAIKNDVAKITGIPEGTPVVAGTADHISSAFMAGIQNDGDLLLKYGGAADILYSTDSLITDRRLFIDYHLIPGKYLINGCMASSGSLLKWFGEQFFGGGKIDFSELDRQAEKIESGSEGLITLPYFIGEKTPIFDPIARGVIFGLTLHHTRYHIYRSILEAVGYGFQHHIDVLKEMGLEPKNVIATNGGAISKTWGKITSNIIGYPIHYLDQNPGSSLGAAFVAGIGTGCFGNWSEVNKFIKIVDIVNPDSTEHFCYQKYYSIYKELYLALKDKYKKLNQIKN
ncbi:MAG: FGGY-family carbohydrate kinase [Candidatus Humimicrobiaceae bacterium]